MNHIRSSIVITIFLVAASAVVSLADEMKFLANREYFHALEDKIKSAKDEILVAMYLFRTTDHKGNLATALREDLIAASSRGVKVTVLLEKEKRGRKGSSLNDDNAFTAKVLSRGGVKVYLDDPETTTHTKLVVIDNRFVFLGSHNFSDSALRFNNEASVMIESPNIARSASSFIRKIE